MILRGLIVATSGFLFIFMPGLPMWLLTRRFRTFDRDLLYWGIGTWFVSLLPMLFLQSLLRQFILGAGSTDAIPQGAWRYLLPFLSALIGAFVVQGALYLVLRYKRPAKSASFIDGLSLGFGSGLVIQVFLGFVFVSSGFRLSFGDLSVPIQQAIAEMPLHLLLTWLIAHLLFRAAVPIVSGALGVVLARAVAGSVRFLFIAIGAYTIFETAFAFVQLGMGDQSSGLRNLDLVSLLVTVGYYVIAFILAYRWLSSQMTMQKSMPDC